MKMKSKRLGKVAGGISFQGSTISGGVSANEHNSESVNHNEAVSTTTTTTQDTRISNEHIGIL